MCVRVCVCVCVCVCACVRVCARSHTQRSIWRNLCSEWSLQLLVTSTEPSVLSFECTVCHRQFRKSQDIVRHKCVTTRPRTGCH